MSAYEQRARDYLDRFTEEPTWDVYSPDAQAALVALCESIAAEAQAIPSTHRLVARSDLAHALGDCDCEFGITETRTLSEHCEAHRWGWPGEHDAAIDRLRAGEEGRHG